MIWPDDWKTYSWDVDAGVGDALVSRLDWRIWEVSVLAAAGAPTLVTIGSGLVTVPAGTGWSTAPGGMLVSPVGFAGVPDAWSITWIRKNVA